MKIFLTGSTGYLGQELMKELHSRGHEITALVRSKAASSGFPSDVKVVEGSIEMPDSYAGSVKGQDVFTHIAALVKMWVRDRKEFDRVNVEGLDQAIQICKSQNVGKFVYASSFMALGPSDAKPLSEDDPRTRQTFHNDYERTKFLGDQVAQKYAAEGYPIYMLYPGVIYGPGNLTYGNIVAKNLIPFLNGKMPFGLSLKEWSYTFIRDVVAAFTSVIETTPPSHRYIVAGENHTGESFYKTLEQVSGKKAPVMNIPIPVAKVAGYGEYLLAQLTGRQPTMLTHEVVEIYKRAWAYDSSRAQREIGYKITPLSDGLRVMIDWLKSAGYVH